MSSRQDIIRPPADTLEPSGERMLGRAPPRPTRSRLHARLWRCSTRSVVGGFVDGVDGVGGDLAGGGVHPQLVLFAVVSGDVDPPEVHRPAVFEVHGGDGA